LGRWEVPISLLFFQRECHLAAIISQKEDNWCEKECHHEVERAGYPGMRASPKDQDDFKNEKNDGKLDLSFDEVTQLQSVIHPPGEETGGYCKGRGDTSKDEKIKTGELKGWVLKDQVKKNEKGRTH
jgi:hypothetical protein